MYQAEMQPLEPSFRSSPIDAFKSIFDTKDWLENVLWLSLGALATSLLIGYLPLLGYAAELIERRSGRPDYPNQKIDSQRLGDYIEKGIWPFAVGAAAYFVIAPINAVMMLVVFGVGGALAEENEAFGVALLVVGVPILAFMSFLASLIVSSLVIRALVVQDFVKSFDFGWCLEFIKKMWVEMLISGLVFGILSIGVYFLGFLAFCIGYIPAVGICLGAMLHLYAQWYEVFLSKGGTPVPPKADMVVEASIV